jgi:hypothetical protein
MFQVSFDSHPPIQEKPSDRLSMSELPDCNAILFRPPHTLVELVVTAVAHGCDAVVMRLDSLPLVVTELIAVSRDDVPNGVDRPAGEALRAFVDVIEQLSASPVHVENPSRHSVGVKNWR